MRSGRLAGLLVLLWCLPAGAVEATEDEVWTLDDELREQLALKADAYAGYALRFDCTETIRVAKYAGSNEAEEKKDRSYGYLLVRDPGTEQLTEYRQKIRKDGTYGEYVDDEEPFPPAYAWVFLFSRFHQPYFVYRDLGDRFDGFDWIREIQFKGVLPFTDGKDIRQWEGTVLVDAVTMTPIEIRGEPSGQADRLEAEYRRWVQAFNLIGFKLAPRPFGYGCKIQFRTRKEDLTFPTELRYDTFRKVSTKQNVPWRASIRTYEDYRFFTQETAPETGTVRDGP